MLPPNGPLLASEAIPIPPNASSLEALRPGLRLIALRSLGSGDAADEAVQETLARAVVALTKGQPNDPSKLPAFVAGIARHVIADVHRTRSRTLSLDGNDVPPPASTNSDPLSAMVSTFERNSIRRALGSLGSADRDLLRLCYYEGLTPGEIARRLGEPSERIRKRKSRALERLRQAFAGGHDAGRKPDKEQET